MSCSLFKTYPESSPSSAAIWTEPPSTPTWVTALSPHQSPPASVLVIQVYFLRAAWVILLKQNSGHMSSLFRTIWHPHLTYSWSWSSDYNPQGPTWPDPSLPPLYSLLLPLSPSLPLLQPQWPLLCSMIILGLPLPQGLCTCYSLWQEHFPQTSTSLARSLPSALSSFSEFFPASLSKMAISSLLPTLPVPLPVLFSPSFSSPMHTHLKYLSYLFSVPPTRMSALWEQNFCLFCSLLYFTALSAFGI